MKTPLLISALLFSIIAASQNPYAWLKNDKHRHMFDEIPIDKGQEQQFYTYAIQLLAKDSLIKAGQIFDRVYWLDTSSLLGKESLSYRKKVEQKVIEQAKAKFIGVWSWNWTGTSWGATDSPEMSGVNKRMELDCSTIKFYRNDSLIRETTYSLMQSFRWFYGSLSNLIQYQDTKEEWAFNFISMDSFTSNRLWIYKMEKIVSSHPVGQSYYLEVEKQQLITATIQ
jgi:hypothetical protein